MEVLNKVLKNIGVLNKLNRAVETSLSFCISGAGVGEKIVALNSIAQDKKVVYVARDSLELMQIKEGLKSLNVNYEVATIDLTAPTFTLVNNNLILLTIVTKDGYTQNQHLTDISTKITQNLRK